MDFGLKPILHNFIFWQYQNTSFQEIQDRQFPGQFRDKMALCNVLLHVVF